MVKLGTICRLVFKPLLPAVFLSAALFQMPLAEEPWVVEKLDGAEVPADPGSQILQKAPGGLPDGYVAEHPEGDIVKAWYGDPTRRYGHGILGDAIEAGALHVEISNGKQLSLQLPETEVFEDRTPRLVDLDGDGAIEIVTIRSSVSKGASVTIYGLVNGALVQRATNGFIGRSNRWLNIAGIASFAGGQEQQIAYVETPHIGGTLYFYAFRNGSLVRTGAMQDFSNHAIGTREMQLSAVVDIDGDLRMELAVPSDNRQSLRIIGTGQKGPYEQASIKLPARIRKLFARRGEGSDINFIVLLDDGQTYRIRR